MVNKTKLLFLPLVTILLINSCRENTIDFSEQENLNKKVFKTEAKLKKDSIHPANYEIENDPIRNLEPPKK